MGRQEAVEMMILVTTAVTIMEIIKMEGVNLKSLKKSLKKKILKRKREILKSLKKNRRHAVVGGQPEASKGDSDCFDFAQTVERTGLCTCSCACRPVLY